MKKLLLSFVVLLCLTPFSHAEVYVYKNKLKWSSTGDGGVAKESITGWTIVNDSGQVVQVLAYPGPKRYAIEPMQSIESGVADAGAGRQCSFFLQHDIWTGGDGSYHVDTGGAKGLNSSITVNGQVLNIPKTYSWSGRSTYQAAGGGAMAFEESSGTFTFDKAQTAASHSAGENIEAASLRLAGILEQQGYVEY